jgi:hypothetical protein
MRSILYSYIKRLLFYVGYRVEKIEKKYPIVKPLDCNGIEVLANEEFIKSCMEVRQLTLLDTFRLATLWQLCRLTNPLGNIIEIGVYKGGASIHLSNCCPDRKIFICDSFMGFEQIDNFLDDKFDKSMFLETDEHNIERLLIGKNRKYSLIKGFFPASCKGINLGPISFAHIDVDVYKSTIETLIFLDDYMINNSLIVIDDYNREAKGVNRAIKEFMHKTDNWKIIPLFPGQALLVNKCWDYKGE